MLQMFYDMLESEYMKKIKNWIRKDSRTYTRICGERMTRLEVIAYNIIFILLAIATITANGWLVVSVACATLAGYILYAVKKRVN